MKLRYLILVSVCFLMFACSKKGNDNQTIHSVQTITLTNSQSQTVKTFSGVVTEKSEINLGFKTPGQIEQIYVKEGDYVHPGQLLARLDSKDYALGVAAAQAQYTQMSNELARMEKLYQSHSISGNDYEKATSGLKQLSVNLQSNKNKLSYTRLYAPVAGYIQSVNFQRAEMVGAGSPVFSLINSGQMKIEISLPMNVYMQRDKISSIDCIVNSQRKSLKLLSIVPKADASQLYKAVLVFSHPIDKSISAGMNVQVNIHLSEPMHAQAISVPLHAIFKQGEKTYVWVLNSNSTISKREITVGTIDNDGTAIVLSGLSGSEQVVTAGVNSLQQGEKVKQIAPQSQTNIGGLL